MPWIIFGIDTGRKRSGAECERHKSVMSSFVHLNVHSDYSKGWGVASIEDLCRRAKTLGMDRLALTDTNGVYGLVFFVQTAKEMGITPIVGSELLCGGRRAVLLVKNAEGYANLCHIISARQCYADFDLVRAITEGGVGSSFFPMTSPAQGPEAGFMEDLFVEMSPGYNMSRCHAFSRKSGISPFWPPTGSIWRKKTSSASPDFAGHVDEHQTVPAVGSGSVPGVQFFKCPAPVWRISIPTRRRPCLIP
jgi:hypothetical protein